MKYSEKLKNPLWQRKRLEILERDSFTCRACSDTKNTLHVHHCYYVYGREPWEYPSFSLVTLCESCHDQLSAEVKSELYPFEKVLEAACDSGKKGAANSFFDFFYFVDLIKKTAEHNGCWSHIDFYKSLLAALKDDAASSILTEKINSELKKLKELNEFGSAQNPEEQDNA